MKKPLFLFAILLATLLIFTNCKSETKPPPETTKTTQVVPKQDPKPTEQLTDNQPPSQEQKKENTTNPKPIVKPKIKKKKKKTVQAPIPKKAVQKATPKPKKEETVVLPPPPKKTKKTSFKIPDFDQANGKEIYNKTCHTCHNMGIAGAPAIQGDSKDRKKWQDISQKEISQLSKHVKEGYSGKKGTMPPGMCINCGEKDYKDVIYYMMELGLK